MRGRAGLRGDFSALQNGSGLGLALTLTIKKRGGCAGQPRPAFYTDQIDRAVAVGG